MANKELYIGTATPKSNEVVWIRPLKSGGVALYAYVYNKWQVLKLVNGKGTLPVDDDEVIDPATPGGNYYTKDEIDEKIADILGIDADQIDELIKIVTDDDTITGLLTELKNKANLNTDNVFTGSNTFQSNGQYSGKIFIRDGEVISTTNNQDGNDLSCTARLSDAELSFYDYDSAHGYCQTHVYYNGSLGNNHLKVNTQVGNTDKEETLAYLSDIPNVSGKENVMPITTATGETLSAVIGKYYRLDNVGTLAITLPTIVGATKLQAITFLLVCGSSALVTFVPQGSETILYQEGFALEADTTCEVTALWNGSEWTLSRVIYE